MTQTYAIPHIAMFFVFLTLNYLYFFFFFLGGGGADRGVDGRGEKGLRHYMKHSKEKMN